MSAFKNIFPVPMLEHFVPERIADDVENLLVSRLDRIPRPTDDAPHSTDYFEPKKVIDLYTDVPELFSEIQECVNKFQEACSIKHLPHTNQYVWWTQDYQEGDIHKEHEHGMNKISGVYWVRANENAGGLSFRNPNPYVEYAHNEYSQYGYGKYEFQPMKGKLLLFPSYLKHQVEPSGKNVIRSTIAFNVVY
mgnify:FL=1|jgi:uncharacterized protein (TIGR02466 family)|tara:strand:- start:1554 stop:2129 length:576 start_codon:yes stop_codon:yes gene_type:complete